jgi:hypothetical protein
MPQIECRDTVRASVDRGLQDHLVGWVRQARSPQEAKFHWFDNCGQRVKNGIRFGDRQSSLAQVFRPGQHRFVLKHQRNRGQHDHTLLKSSQQQLTRSAWITPQRR